MVTIDLEPEEVDETKLIAVDEIPRYSDWPERIMGFKQWNIPDRDLEKIEEEYELEKYNNLLRNLDQMERKTPWEVKKRQILGRDLHIIEGENSHHPVCVSKDSQLYVMPILSAQRFNDKIVTEVFSNILEGDETVVELGCGYGYNAHILNNRFPDISYIGGEYSENAVKLADYLYSEEESISVEQFNYYDDDWSILQQNIEGDIIVFSRLSIEQLPSCDSVIDKFAKSIPDNVREVLHFEPIYEFHDSDSLLGLLRKRYTEINDYNRDLASVITENKNSIIVESEYDIFGFNGLNPMSLLRWKPCYHVQGK